MSPFGPLDALRRRPIPAQDPARALKQGFRGHPIDSTAPAFREPLKDARGLIAGENYYNSSRNPPYWQRIDGAVAQLFLRGTVLEKLRAVNERLAPQGLELFLFDAWRPRAVQAHFHDVWMPRELAARHRGLGGEALTKAVEAYWSAPTSDPASPAPHETGAAADLTLRWREGESLWMGSLFDDASPLSHRDRFEHLPEGVCFSDEEARANRRLLHWLMVEEGFIGHPDEWWHFSHGDQLWARLSGRPAACYGLSSPVSAAQ